MPDRDNIFVKEVKIEPFLLKITTLNFKVLTAVVCLCIFFHSALWFAFIFFFLSFGKFDLYAYVSYAQIFGQKTIGK